MTTTTPAGGKAGSAGRFTSVMLLGGAVALLLSGVFGFDRARTEQIKAEAAMAQADVALTEARGREQLAKRNVVLLDVANAVQKHAQRSAVLPRSWGERQFNLRQQNLARDQVNFLLLSTVRSSMQMLKPEEFELSVTHADEGLFDSLAVSRLPLRVTLRGSLYFRISERPL